MTETISNHHSGLGDRRATGLEWRRKVPLCAPAQWTPPADRADPVDILTAQEGGRISELMPVRYARMKADPFAFLRGAAAVMAADLAPGPATGLRVQSCGDCHLANFGSYASPEGTPVFDVNDFDETLPAPFEWDVKRLAASLAVAGRVAASTSAALSPTSTRLRSVEKLKNGLPKCWRPGRRILALSKRRTGAGASRKSRRWCGI